MGRHDFRASLRCSMTKEGDRKTEIILREYFAAPPDFQILWEPRNTPFGHDCDVVAWGHTYTIEEKRRARDYGDDLLEDISNTTTRTPGWTRKCSDVDYVLMVYPARWEIYPGGALCSVFNRMADEWRDCFGQRHAINVGYRTINIPVPPQSIRRAIAIHTDTPLCYHCCRPVGCFGTPCANEECSHTSCCVITDGDWLCISCMESS